MSMTPRFIEDDSSSEQPLVGVVPPSAASTPAPVGQTTVVPASASSSVEMTTINMEGALGSNSEEEEMRNDAQTAMTLTAASRNQLKRLRDLLATGVSPNTVNHDKRTPLHLACSEGHLEVAQLLLEQGADPNATDRFGSTPLDEAMRGRHLAVVDLLRKYKANHSGLGKMQAKLIEHVAKGELAEVQSLLALDVHGQPVKHSLGISPNCCDWDKRTPLHLAVAEGNVAMVDLLLANGADASAVDRWGLTPLAEMERLAARVGQDPVREVFRARGVLPHEESIWSFFSIFFGLWEGMMIILLGLFVRYGHRADGQGPVPEVYDANGDATTNAENLVEAGGEAANEIQRVYPMFQDVQVMIFMGFGFLMVFLRKHGYTSVALTFLIAAFVIQWYQLTAGFWNNAFLGSWDKIPIAIEDLVKGNFCAGAVMVTFGVLLGKVNPAQMLFIAIIETVFYSLNERIGFRLGVADIGGSMTIHMFGAYFGIAASLMMTPRGASGHENNAANYHSDIMAMIGTIFLWLYWPSFNGALAAGATQERAIINTSLALCASNVTAFMLSHILRREKKFNMVDIQNATLAGGVALGASCEMILFPGSASAIGAIAGGVSVFGYVYVQPFLERKIGLHDTCGVHNLHGMPSIIGGFASVIGAWFARNGGIGEATGYGYYQLRHIFTERTGFADDARSASMQSALQFAYMVISFFMALVVGGLTGHLAMSRLFKPTKVENMFVDSEYWEVPHLETPYFFDQRGEVPHAGELADDAAGGAKATSEAAREPSKVGPIVGNGRIAHANLDAPDNAQLLALITSLETRLNDLSTRTVGTTAASQSASPRLAIVPDAANHAHAIAPPTATPPSAA